MDLDRMLEKCRAGQWEVEDIDWDAKPRAMSEADERATVQYFLDMEGIENIARALFEEQKNRVSDPRLLAIFDTFIADEIRHAECAARLAEHFNVRRLQTYTLSPSLVSFAPAFISALKHFSAEVANLYVTGGELLLDVALLRSINDFVADPLADSVMDRINRDESRHIAIDYYMVSHYASSEYQAKAALAPRKSVREQLSATAAFLRMIRHMRPFASAVFLEPMRHVDPDSRRMTEAWKRLQLLVRRPDVAVRPLPRVINGVQDLAEVPVIGEAAAAVAGRLVGLPDAMMRNVTSAQDRARAARTPLQDMANEASAS